MVSASGSSEKCMYGNWFQENCYFSADCSILGKSEFCYECINCWRCSSCVWCQNCFDCVSVSFSMDCHGCSNCFGCIGLRNKSYCWFNEQLSKEDYEKRLKGFGWGRTEISRMIKKIKEFSFTLPPQVLSWHENNFFNRRLCFESAKFPFEFQLQRK